VAALEGPAQARPAYELVIAKFPTSRWAEYASTRLAEITGSPGQGGAGSRDIYGEAMARFDRGAYQDARDLFARVVEADPSARIGELAAYFIAVSYFKEGRFRDTIGEFETFVNAYAGSDLVPEAYYHVALSHSNLQEPAMAREVFEGVIRDFPDSRWAGYSKERLRERIVAQSELG
jgi:TolA-binding protein